MSLAMEDGVHKRSGRFKISLASSRSRKSRMGESREVAARPVLISSSTDKLGAIEIRDLEEDDKVIRDTVPSESAVENYDGDRERTRARYDSALKVFDKALQLRKGKWKILEDPKFDIPCEDPSKQLRAQIDRMLGETKNQGCTDDLWSKGKTIMERAFVSLCPLTTNLLSIARSASQMSGAEPIGMICTGISVLITIASKEISRRKDIERGLDYISRQLGALQILDKLPDAGVEVDHLVNRALDVVSASLNYLSAHIVHQRHGIIQSALWIFLSGDKKLESVEVDLKSAVDEFNSSLARVGHGVGFRVFDLLQGNPFVRKFDVDAMAADRCRTSGSDLQERFILPYRRNDLFTGRQTLLVQMRQMLFSVAPKRYNHRVALHGLGGVGKTQLALEYAYSQKDNYERVYWISAVSEDTLFAGFQELATKSGWIHKNAKLAPKELVSLVQRKLQKLKSWLMVFDNLDNFEIADSYFPDVDTDKHLLMTTRNPHHHQIPAEGVEVTVLEIDEATDFLLTRSNTSSKPPERAEATLIVNELGCLPLAIEQAAAYIRETLKDIFKYISSYRKSQKAHHHRHSKGNRQYYQESLATTWNLSFRQLSEDAGQLLRLMAFLNPDGILTNFLEEGKNGLDLRLRNCIGDFDSFSDALGELERFSLIRRQADVAGGHLVTIHRLVQAVVRDAMEWQLFSDMSVNAIQLCISGFPAGDFQDHPILAKCRRYYSQVTGPMSMIPIHPRNLGCLLHRLGVFLAADGKFEEAVKMLERAKEVSEKTVGKENSYTLNAATDLAWAYYENGRPSDSLALAEKLLHLRAGMDDDEATLSLMGGIAGLYCSQGQYQISAEKQAEVVEKSKRILGPEHRDTLRAIEVLSLIFVLDGRWTEAEGLQAAVLEVRRRILGEDSLLTYVSLSNLSGLYQYQGKYDLARRLTEPVVEARVRLLGDHPWTFWAKMGLGAAWAECGMFTESLKMLEEASDGLAATMGLEHPLTLIAKANLGYGYSDQKQFEKSISLLESTIEVAQRVSGADHFCTLWMKDCLAQVYYRHAKLDRAITLLGEVLKARERVLRDGHCLTLSNQKRLQHWLQVQPVESSGAIGKQGELEEKKEFVSDGPLRLRNTSAWLTFSVKPVVRWELKFEMMECVEVAAH